MRTFTTPTFNRAYPRMVEETLVYGDRSSPAGTAGVRETRELHPAIIEVEHPERHLITAVGRPVNVTFAMAEVLWILAGRNDLSMLDFYNSNIKNFSDDGRTFNAAYGYRLRKQFGHDQINDVVRTLEDDLSSRRAILSIWHPQYDRGHEGSRRRDTKDRACNLTSMLLVRNNKLEWTQIQRSNDLIWGTPYNYMQFSHLHRWIANLLGVAVGRFTHVVNSLHIYENFYTEAEDIRFFDLYSQMDERVLSHWEEWGQVSDELVMELAAHELVARSGEEPEPELNSLPPYWFGMIALFHAHAMYRQGKDAVAADILTSNCHPVYGLAQMRFYWAMRWSKKRDEFPEVMRYIDKQTPAVARWIKGE